MKRHTPQITLINKKRESVMAESGGLTLETALVMPVFLMIVMFLIFMVQTAIISMALHGALSQTARQAASTWYPISLATEQARASEPNEQIENWNSKWLKVADVLVTYGKWLPSPMKEWAEQASKGTISLEQGVARQAFSQLIKQFIDEDVLDPGRLNITEVGLPDEVDRESAYLTIEAEYKLPVQVPFLGRKLILRESTRERAWIGGSPSLSRIAEDGEEAFNVSFVSLEPNPVRLGRKATLVLRTTPGTAVDLSIIYKSGFSQAKHLGSATADASGLVSWTWHVSGRTTPGQWNWQVSNADGGIWMQPFEVAGKSTTDSKEDEQ